MQRRVVARAFSTARRLRSARGDAPPPNPNSPFRVFVDTFKKELKKSQELQDSVKALQGEGEKIGESEAYKKAREAFEAAQKRGGAAAGITGKAIRKTGEVLGQGVVKAWESPVGQATRKGAAATGQFVDKATKPIRESSAYKSLSDTIDDGQSARYGGFSSPEARAAARRRQDALDEARPVQRPVEANEDQTGVVLHKDAAWKESWKNFKDNSSMFAGLNRFKHNYNESENPIVSSTREFTDRVAEIWGKFTAESESAKVIRMMKEIDPAFQVEPWLNSLREYILPEICDAYIKNDTETLALWLSEAPLSVHNATSKQVKESKLVSDGRIVDLRHVDIAQYRVVPPNDIPVFIVSFRTQEIHLFRNMAGEIVAGREDKVQAVTYIAIFTRLKDQLSEPVTRGWRVMDFVKGPPRDII
ncbi:protein translocase subunit [Savitreella phatthalungensis]